MQKHSRCTGAGGRGCPCRYHEAHRRANQKWRREGRRESIDRVRQRSTTCPRRSGSHVCGGRLETYIDNLGRTKVRCPLCARREAGVCRDCPAPVEGRVGMALRCARHKVAFRRKCTRRWTANNKDKVAAKARARAADPARRARMIELKRLWRLANPDKVRAQKERYKQRHAGRRSSRYEQYHAQYRTRYRGYAKAQRVQARELARATRPVKPCAKCGASTGWVPLPECGGRPWATCMSCCWPYERREREAARARYAAVAAKKLASLKVVVPKRAAARGPGLERLCITAGCDIVVTHRKKKCTRCQERDRRAAAAVLAATGGRGRRNDLVQVA